MAERVHFKAYFMLTACVGGFIYPVIQRAFWYSGGLFVEWGEYGVVDFAGSGVVHMTGGSIGLFGTWYIGPRLNLARILAKPQEPFKVGMSILGAFLLSIGWFSFNAGSARSPNNSGTGGNAVAALAAVNTLMGGAGGVLSAITAFCMPFGSIAEMTGHFSGEAASTPQKGIKGLSKVNDIMIALLGGLVSITGPAAVISPHSSLIIGDPTIRKNLDPNPNSNLLTLIFDPDLHRSCIPKRVVSVILTQYPSHLDSI